MSAYLSELDILPSSQNISACIKLHSTRLELSILNVTTASRSLKRAPLYFVSDEIVMSLRVYHHQPWHAWQSSVHIKPLLVVAEI